MRTLVVYVLFMTCGGCLSDYYQSSSYFCTNINPQHIVDINQLEGIWYVLEKIIHTEERHYVINVTTCPVIHISEDLSQSTTYNPLVKTYDTTYGSGYSYDGNTADTRSTLASEQDYTKQREEYDRRTTYDYQRRKTGHTAYIKHLYAMKHLRIYWDDNSYSTEYHLRYNVSQPGFWISSGPEGGRIPEDRKHFAGTIQVIKAVGNHLVLTFCHPEPDKNKLFTIILSRENRLDSRDIHSVHGILIRKGLTTNAVEKSCNKAPSNGMNLVLTASISAFYIFYFVKSSMLF